MADVIFKSAITRGGNILCPDTIIINECCVTYKKRNKILVNYDTVTIPLNHITSVTVDSSLLGTDIVVSGFGGEQITLKNFTKRDAGQIRSIILRNKNLIK